MNATTGTTHDTAHDTTSHAPDRIVAVYSSPQWQEQATQADVADMRRRVEALGVYYHVSTLSGATMDDLLTDTPCVLAFLAGADDCLPLKEAALRGCTIVALSLERAPLPRLQPHGEWRSQNRGGGWERLRAWVPEPTDTNDAPDAQKMLEERRARVDAEMHAWRIYPLDDPHTWAVANGSETKPMEYLVTYNPNDAHAHHCTCPDYLYRARPAGIPCKHVLGIARHLNHADQEPLPGGAEQQNGRDASPGDTWHLTLITRHGELTVTQLDLHSLRARLSELTRPPMTENEELAEIRVRRTV